MKSEVREWPPKGKTPGPNAQEARPTEAKEKPKDPEHLFVGKRVLVRLMDGSSLEGVLSLMHQYTFLLEVDGTPTLIYKHAVRSIEEIR